MSPGIVTQPLAVLMVVAAASLGCAHTQQPERRNYVISDDASGVGSKLKSGTGGAGADAYCNEVQKQCFKQCWERKPDLPSIEKHSEKHYKHCTSGCLEVFMNCIKEQEALERKASRSERKELRFQSMDTALDWLRKHKAEVALGTVVIVGSVAATPYVIAVLGGALILAPL